MSQLPIFLAEYPLKTATKSNVALDGALWHGLRSLILKAQPR